MISNHQASTTCGTHLDCIELLLTTIPLVSQTDNGSSTLADGDLLADTVFLEETDGARTSFRTSAPVRVGLLAASCRARGRSPPQLGSTEKVLEGELLATVRVHRGRSGRRTLAGGLVITSGGSRGYPRSRGRWLFLLVRGLGHLRRRRSKLVPRHPRRHTRGTTGWLGRWNAPTFALGRGRRLARRRGNGSGG